MKPKWLLLSLVLVSVAGAGADCVLVISHRSGRPVASCSAWGRGLARRAPMMHATAGFRATSATCPRRSSFRAPLLAFWSAHRFCPTSSCSMAGVPPFCFAVVLVWFGSSPGRFGERMVPSSFFPTRRHPATARLPIRCRGRSCGSDRTMIGSYVLGFGSYWLVGLSVAWLAPYPQMALGYDGKTVGWIISAMHAALSRPSYLRYRIFPNGHCAGG